MTSVVLRDAIGQSFAPCAGAPRIVSLVPSLTELLFDLGLGHRLVGRTGFCIHPAPAVKAIPKIGGTKDVNLERLRALTPTHVIANVDENRREQVEAMREFVPHVVVTHPLRPADNAGLFRLLGGLFGAEAAAGELEKELDIALQEVREAAYRWSRERVIYAIWKDPWMAVSRETYISAMLAEVGWETLPAAADLRYPGFNLGDECLRDAEYMLLSSEPYRFGERDRAELARMPAMSDKRIELIDGERVSWYGSRAIAGLRYLRDFRAARESH